MRRFFGSILTRTAAYSERKWPRCSSRCTAIFNRGDCRVRRISLRRVHGPDRGCVLDLDGRMHGAIAQPSVRAVPDLSVRRHRYYDVPAGLCLQRRRTQHQSRAVAAGPDWRSVADSREPRRDHAAGRWHVAVHRPVFERIRVEHARHRSACRKTETNLDAWEGSQCSNYET